MTRRVTVVYMGACVLRKLVPDQLFTCLPPPRMFKFDSVTPPIQKSRWLPPITQDLPEVFSLEREAWTPEMHLLT